MSIRVVAAAAVAAAGLTLGGVAPAATAGTVQFTGTQLRSALLPQSAFPGYTLRQDAGDSGSRLETGQAKFRLATMSCASFGKNFGDKGFGESAEAGIGYGQPGDHRQYAQQVYQFRTPAAALAFFSGVRAIAHRCPAFAFSGSGIKVTTHTFDAAPLGGHRIFEADQSGSIFTQRFTVHLLFSVAGQDVFLLGAFGNSVAPPPVRPDMLKLINRVRAFR